jgi:hypothetical protein
MRRRRPLLALPTASGALTYSTGVLIRSGHAAGPRDGSTASNQPSIASRRFVSSSGSVSEVKHRGTAGTSAQNPPSPASLIMALSVIRSGERLAVEVLCRHAGSRKKSFVRLRRRSLWRRLTTQSAVRRPPPTSLEIQFAEGSSCLCRTLPHPFSAGARIDREN